MADTGDDKPGGPRYTDHGDGTVTDNVTDLTWQQLVPTAPTGCSSGAFCTWEEAKKYCTGLALSGTGWRLPTREEFTTLILESGFPPVWDMAAFPPSEASDFWTSSPYPDLPGWAWLISFQTGGTYGENPTMPHSVRCVR